MNQWGNITSTRQKSKTKRPINIARKTSVDRSLLLMTPISPVRKANTPETPASSEGIVRARLLKYVSPPRCPNAIKIRNTAKNKKNTIINPVDHLPKGVFGKILTRMLVF